MIAKTFTHLMKNPQISRNSKYANVEIQEKKINWDKHIVVKMLKAKDRENQKSNKEKRIIT